MHAVLPVVGRLAPHQADPAVHSYRYLLVAVAQSIAAWRETRFDFDPEIKKLDTTTCSLSQLH